MEPAQLSQTSIPTYITPSGQSSRPAPLGAPESNRSSFAAFEAPPAEAPPLISSDRSLDKLRPERGISRRTVVVGLGIVGRGGPGDCGAWSLRRCIGLGRNRRIATNVACAGAAQRANPYTHYSPASDP